MDRAAGVRRLLFIAALFICAALIASLAIYLAFHVPTVTPRVWLEYMDRRANGVAPFLTDFSYAGYHYQSAPIPHVNGTVFDVTQFGARPGQGYADAGVQAAIDAAQSAGGGVVYFPAGEYKFGPASGGRSDGNCLQITASNVVLRGEGKDKTTLYLENWLKGDKFLIYAAGESGKTMANLADSVYRGTAQLKVDKVGRIKPGVCFRLVTGPAPQLLKPWFGDTPMDETWTEVQQGIRVDHPHCIRTVDPTNQILTLEEPIHFDLPLVPGVVVSLRAIRPLREIGIEHLRFRSGWANRKEELCHNCNEMMIRGWQAVGLNTVRDTWIRSCVFDSFIQAVRLDTSSAVTVVDNMVVGKMGHHSFRSLRGYGNLYADNTDAAGTVHGPSVQSSDMGTVFLRHVMKKGQSIDMHGDMATHTLLDSVQGGQLFVSGGKEAVFPNHALELTVWNFKHRADATLKGTAYRFWPVDLEDERRFGSVYYKPVVVGLYGDQVEIDKTTAYHMDAIGKRANPASLFEAQVRMRLNKGAEYRLPLAPFAPGYQSALAAARVDEALTIHTNYHPKVVRHFISWRKVKSGLIFLASLTLAAIGCLAAYRLVLRPAWERRRNARAQEAQLDSYRMLPDDPMA